MSKWTVIAGALLLLVLVGLHTPALANDLDGQSELTSAPSTVSVAAVDTSGTGTRVRTILCRGNPTLYVAPISSTYSGATATVQVDLYVGSTYIGTAYRGTLTFGTTASGGVYPSSDVILAIGCKGADRVDVKITALSNGAITFKRWVGVAEAGAEAGQ